MRVAPMSHFPDLLKAVDAALYAAKRGGRNVVKIAQAVAGELAELAEATAAEAASPQSAPINYAAVLERCGGDPTFAAAITEKFQTHAIDEVSKIEKAHGTANADALRRAAHTAKSMCAYMSADRASKLANAIEELGMTARLGEVLPLLAQLRSEVERAIAWINENKPAAVSQDQ